MAWDNIVPATNSGWLETASSSQSALGGSRQLRPPRKQLQLCNQPWLQPRDQVWGGLEVTIRQKATRDDITLFPPPQAIGKKVRQRSVGLYFGCPGNEFRVVADGQSLTDAGEAREAFEGDERRVVDDGQVPTNAGEAREAFEGDEHRVAYDAQSPTNARPAD
jgi:hypothetical protein